MELFEEQGARAPGTAEKNGCQATITMATDDEAVEGSRVCTMHACVHTCVYCCCPGSMITHLGHCFKHWDQDKLDEPNLGCRLGHFVSVHEWGHGKAFGLLTVTLQGTQTK